MELATHQWDSTKPLSANKKYCTYNIRGIVLLLTQNVSVHDMHSVVCVTGTYYIHEYLISMFILIMFDHIVLILIQIDL